MLSASIKSAGSLVGTTLTKNAPTILTVFGVVGTVTTTVMAVKATPLALEAIREKEENYENEKLTTLEIFLATWRCYLPAATMGAATIGCIIGANHINLQRQALLTGAYTIANTKLNEYKQKVVETIGPRKEQSIRESIGGDHIKDNPASTNQVIVTGRGNVLMYDDFSGRYFRSDLETVRRIQNDLNQRLLGEMSISVNDLYTELGLADIPMGEDYGWAVDEEQINITYPAKVTDDGEPCIILLYEPTILKRMWG